MAQELNDSHISVVKRIEPPNKSGELMIKPELTAISRNRMSAPLKRAFDMGIVRFPALDWGCGKGADVTALKNVNSDVCGYDPFFRPNLPEATNGFAYAQCVYVLNVIPSIRDRVKTLAEMSKFLNPNANVMVVARGESRVNTPNKKKNYEQHLDGWLVPKGDAFTFQAGISKDSLRRWMIRAGFRGVDVDSFHGMTYAIIRGQK